MTTRGDYFNPRPGRIRHGNQGARRPKSFVGEVMRATKKAGHRGRTFGQSSGTIGRSTFGRGRRAALSLSSRSPSRRVVIMTRIVRHRGKRFRSAPLAKHVAYLKRESVSRNDADARMFDASSGDADTKTFAERCEEDRHHFRFMVSPEDAGQMADLRGFTRELMKDAERDLGTRLDWIAVDHWNTDNPHIHVLVRGRADNGHDLVISHSQPPALTSTNGFAGPNARTGQSRDHEGQALLGSRACRRWDWRRRGLDTRTMAAKPMGGAANMRIKDEDA
jgi:hypothetical protein